MQNEYRCKKKIPFFAISSVRTRKFLTILKNGNEYLGNFFHFNSFLNIFSNTTIKFFKKKKKIYIKLFKAIIINGSKICFITFL